MKRIGILIIVIIALTISSCGKKDISNPAEFSLDKKTMHYTDNKEIVEKLVGSGTDTKVSFLDGYSYDDKFKIIYNEDDSIRYIEINDTSIYTYKNISVGDNIKKVKDIYKYGIETGKNYSVLFNGTKEVDSATENKSDDWVWINYLTDDSGNIEKITIYDFKFGEKML